jgi:hypothetical protein
VKYPEEEADEREREARETYLKPIVKDPVTDFTRETKVTRQPVPKPPLRKEPE